MNGCHSQITPNRLQSDLIYHSKGKVSWANVFTRECQYIKQENIVDDGCDGCRENIKSETQNISIHDIMNTAFHKTFFNDIEKDLIKNLDN